MPRLIVIEGNAKGQTFDLTDGITFIGRSTRSDIRVKDSAVSRKHLKIFHIGKKIFLEDLKSTNGTFINSERIEPGEGFEVSEGDVITIGKTSLQFEVSTGPGKPAKVNPAGKKTNDLKEPLSQKPSERRKRTARELKLINKVSKLLKQSFSLYGFSEKVLEYLLQGLPRIDTAAIVILDYRKDKHGKERTIVVKSRPWLERRDADFFEQIVDRVLKQKGAVRMSNTAFEELGELKESVETLKIGSVLCVPVISNSVIRGALYVDSIGDPYGFRKEDLLLLNSLSGSIAVAFEKAMLSGEERKPFNNV
jgi:3',5'-cyclic-nucleotide phosphodiesterase